MGIYLILFVLTGRIHLNLLEVVVLLVLECRSLNSGRLDGEIRDSAL